MSVAVLGAGAFGTALAISLARKAPTTLWCRDETHAAEMQASQENTRRLPKAPLPASLTVTSDNACFEAHDVILLAVPMQKMRSFLAQHRAALATKTLVACCKGIELDTGLGPVSVLREAAPEATAALLTDCFCWVGVSAAGAMCGLRPRCPHLLQQGAHNALVVRPH